MAWEKKSLGEVCEYSKDRIKAEELTPDNYVGIDNILPDRGGKRSSKYIPNKGTAIRYQVGDIIIGNIRLYLKKIWLANQEGGSASNCLTFRIKDKNIIDPAYLYFVLGSDRFFNYMVRWSYGSIMPVGNKVKAMEYKIPIPPLQEQKRIVEFLDSFSNLISNLISELDLRKLQYSYYRNKLLSFDESVEWKELGEVVTCKGSNISLKDLKDKKGLYPVYGASGIVGYSPSYAKEEKSVGIVKDGSGYGRVFLLPEKSSVISTLNYLETNQDLLNISYLYYFLQTINFSRYVLGAAIPHIYFRDYQNIKIPIPPLQKQKEIVSILDEFENLTNNFKKGIPREIELRKQQLSYYRDKILKQEIRV